jgi:hypothetical protein
LRRRDRGYDQAEDRQQGKQGDGNFSAIDREAFQMGILRLEDSIGIKPD